MLHFIPRTTRRIGGALTAAILLGAVLFIPASPALAQAAPSPVSTAKAVPAKNPVAKNSVEARIKSLHDALRITAAQEPQWQAVAEVMRDNAKATGALIEERTAKAKTMTAIDDLYSYQAIAEAHAAGIKKLIPTVEALYATMSDEQKKNADVVFREKQDRVLSRHRKPQ